MLNINSIFEVFQLIWFRKIGDINILIEQVKNKEICSKCRMVLEDRDYSYRLRDPNVITYVCSKCGYFEIYVEE